MEDMNFTTDIVGTEVNGGISTSDMLKVGGIGAAIGGALVAGIFGIVKIVKTYKKGREAEKRELDVEYEEVQ